MSTVISQLTLSIGGSQFEGAMGSMLVEVLLLMRDIASKLQKAVGSDSLDLLPTVLVAYTMASILIGLCFLILGTLKLGWIVKCFPHPVLQGTVGWYAYRSRPTTHLIHQ